jgi:hypothetical protein
MMDAATEHKQWEFCVCCGTQMVPHPRHADQGGGGYPWLVCPQDLEYYNTPYNQFATDDDAKARMALKQCAPPATFLPLEQLVHGAYYRGKCRNAHVARWNAETQKFIYMREKFRRVFPEEIGYWIAAKPGEHRFDEFKPYALMEIPPFEIPLTLAKSQ